MRNVLLSLLLIAVANITAFSQILPKGNMAQAYNFAGGTYSGHVQFDVDDVSGTMTQKSSFSISGSPAGGEYYNGVWYFTTVEMMFYAIDCETGEVIMQTPTNQFVVDMAYDYSTHTMYGSRSAILYTLNLETGQFTQLFSLTGLSQSSLHTMAIDLDGNMYGIEYSTGDLFQVEKTTGVCTRIGSTGVQTLFVQTMGFDHNTETLYWCQTKYNEQGNFYQVNPQTAEVTLLAENVGRMTSFFVPYTPDQDVAAAPTNFQVIPDPDMNLSAQLSWNNPTMTIGGVALTDIESIEIVRNFEVIHTINNPTPGAAMTWTDNTIPIAGAYDYQVYAITTAGQGYAAIVNDVVIGETCTITVLMYDISGGGWNRGYIDFEDDEGVIRGTARLGTGSEGTVDVVLPKMMNVNCVWHSGLFDDYCSFIITNFVGTEIYVSEGTPQAGLFFTFTNICNMEVPNECTNFIAEADPDGELIVDISWTNPTTTFSGNTLTELSSIIIEKDGVVIHTIENPIIGGNESYVDDDIIAPGKYTYGVYGVNSDGDGVVVSELIDVGFFFFMPTEGSIVINSCGAVLYDDGGFDNNYSNSVTSMAIIFPTEPNNAIEINGTFDIEIDYDFLYVFDGAGIESPLIRSYTGAGTINHQSTTGPLTLFFTSDNSNEASGFVFDISCFSLLGINENEANFEIYPNPANDYIKIESEDDICDVTLYNVLGQKIKTVFGSIVQTSDLSEGVYVVKANTLQGKSYSKRVVINH